MAIEITPKRKLKTPFLIAIIVASLLVLVGLVLLGSYFYFAVQIKKMSKALEEKAQIVAPLLTDIKEKENELMPLKQKIDDFGDLLSKHKKPKEVLEFLEKITLPKVWFQNFSFNSGTGAITISGQTESFLMFEYQTFVLSKEPSIKNLNLTKVSIDKEGKVNFSYQFTIDPKVFTP